MHELNAFSQLCEENLHNKPSRRLPNLVRFTKNSFLFKIRKKSSSILNTPQKETIGGVDKCRRLVKYDDFTLAYTQWKIHGLFFTEKVCQHSIKF